MSVSKFGIQSLTSHICTHGFASSGLILVMYLKKTAVPMEYLTALRIYFNVPNLKQAVLCPPPWGVDILFLLFPPSDVRRPMSGVTHGFRSFKGKVLELLSPNLVCRLIGSVACLGLLLAVVPLLLPE